MKVIIRFSGTLITKVFEIQTGISEVGGGNELYLMLYNGYSQN